MIPPMIRLLIVLAVCGSLQAACNLQHAPKTELSRGGDADLGARVAATAKPRPPAAKPTAQATAESAAPTPTIDRCRIEAGRPTRRISADVAVDYSAKTAAISQRIEFLNREDAVLDQIILDVQANQWPDSFSLESLTIDGQTRPYELDLNRLQIDLAEPLAAGCWLEISLRFQLRVSEIRDGLRSYRGFLGYSPRQLNLGHFLPTVAARLGGAWRIHAPAGIGEQIVHAVADWEVKLRVDNAAETLQLAAPGAVKSIGELAWMIRLPGSRDLALSLSEEFDLLERQLPDGRSLAVYSFADAQVNDRGLILDGAAHALSESVKAFELFERRFGRYPYDRLVIVQGDFPDGMEFTGLVFVGSAWFYGFDGTAKNYLTLISVHEIAHQWWYARVGNDAALSPWLDEALATYSEYLYIEEFYPDEKNWWWYFRVAVYLPEGGVDSAVYEFSTPREYINAVYLRGAQMLQNIRDDIGDESFFRLLRAYNEAGDGLIVDSAFFWRQLAPDQQPLTAATRNEFLANPAVYAPAG
ncbi:MAG: M1 family metallopeptidase [Chloroflexi bacterium]|nr:M1 family metallopeptidase [Chloroflexota bacterium]